MSTSYNSKTGQSTSVFNVNTASDFEIELNWPSSDGTGNADLTGHSVSIFHPDNALNPVASIVDASSGLIRIRQEWNDSIPENQVLPFRIVVTDGTGQNQASSNLLGVRYS